MFGKIVSGSRRIRQAKRQRASSAEGLRAVSQAARACIERLESRQLLSGSPGLTVAVYHNVMPGDALFGGDNAALTRVTAFAANSANAPNYTFVDTNDAFNFAGDTGAATPAFLGDDAAGMALTDTTNQADVIYDAEGFFVAPTAGTYTFQIGSGANNEADDIAGIYIGGNGTPGSGTLVAADGWQGAVSPFATSAATPGQATFSVPKGNIPVEIIYGNGFGGAYMHGVTITDPSSTPVAYLTSATVSNLPAAPTLGTPVTGSDEVILNWNTVLFASSYSVYRNGSATPLAMGLTSPTYTDKAVTAGTQYMYTVTADNSAGSSPKSNSQSVTVLGTPAAPTGVTANRSGTSSTVLISWTPALTAGASTTYDVKRGTVLNADGTLGGTIIDVTPGGTSSTSATDTSASPTSDFFYAVTAMDSTGTSAPSTAAKAAAVAAQPGLYQSVYHHVAPGNALFGGDNAALTRVANFAATNLPNYTFVNTADQFNYSGDSGAATNTFLGTDAAGQAATDTTDQGDVIYDAEGFFVAPTAGTYTFQVGNGNNNEADDISGVYVGGTGVPGSGTLIAADGWQGATSPFETAAGLPGQASITLPKGNIPVEIIYGNGFGGAFVHGIAITDPGSNPVSYVTQAPSNIVPSAPVLNAPVTGDKEVILNWNNVVFASSYSVYRSDSATPITTGLKSNTYTDKAVTGGTAYTYTITADSGAGSSPKSNSQTVTALAAPAPPTNVAASRIGVSSSVGISWTPAATVQPGTTYDVKRGTVLNANGTLGGTIVDVTPGGVSGTSATDASASASTAFFYAVTATDGNGTSAASNPAVQVAAVPATAGLQVGVYHNQPGAVFQSGDNNGLARVANFAAANGPSYTFIDTNDAFNFSGDTGALTPAFLGDDAAGAALTDTNNQANSIYDAGGYFVAPTAGTYKFQIGTGANNQADDVVGIFVGGNGTPGSGTLVAADGWQGATSAFAADPVNTPGSATFMLPAGNIPVEIIYSNGNGGAFLDGVSITAPDNTPVAYKTSAPDTIVPAAPTLNVPALGNNQVHLTWTAVNFAKTYSVFRSDNPGTPIASGLIGTSFTDKSVTAGTSYTYTVTAVNAAGSSPASNAQMVTAAASVPLATEGAVEVDLRASDLAAGSSVSTWTNNGKAGGTFAPFTGGTMPTVVAGADTNGLSYQAVSLGGTSSLTSSFNSPDDLNLNSARSIEVWVLNPTIDGIEETMVSWAKRGGPDGTNASFSYGSIYAVGEWGGEYDMTWAGSALPGGPTTAPAANVWHNLTFTYDGAGTEDVYVDGQLQLTGASNGLKNIGQLSTAAGFPVNIGAQNDGMGNAAIPANLDIASVRISNGALTSADVLQNFNAGVPGQAKAAAPKLVSTTFGDSVSSGAVANTTQRSEVRDVQLKFDHAVTLAAGAVTLGVYSGTTATGTTTDASEALGTPTSADGGLTWIVPVLANTANSDSTGSLKDGIYVLTVHASKVTDSSSNTLSGGDQTTTFHRLFGDFNGDKKVNNADYFQFNKTFGKSSSDAGFVGFFDFNGDGKINNSDYFQFNKNFGKVFTY